jgi:hypothetical protein
MIFASILAVVAVAGLSICILQRDREILTLKKRSARVDARFVSLTVISVILALIAFYAYNSLNPPPPALVLDPQPPLHHIERSIEPFS